MRSQGPQSLPAGTPCPHGTVAYLSQTEVAERLGITTRQVRKLTRLGMPRAPDRAGRGRKGRFTTYPWPAVQTWYQAFKDNERAVRAAAYARRRAATQARAGRQPPTSPFVAP